MRKNPVYGDRKPPRKRAASRLVSDYKEPLRRLRSIGWKFPNLPALSDIRRVEDLTPAQRENITRVYSNYDYLFSRPHIVADFSLPESKVRAEFRDWEKDVALALRKDGYSAKEIKRAIADAGGYDEFARRRVEQNDAQKIAAQEFAGHHVLDKNLTAAVIPVVTGMPDKVRLKYDKNGQLYVQEGSVTTRNIKFNRAELVKAKSKRKYLEKLLAKYGDDARFMIVTGDHMTMSNSGKKEDVISKLIKFMERGTSGKTLKRLGRERVDRNHPEHYTSWLMGLRVMEGNPYHTFALRKAFDDERKRMKAERKAAYEAAAELKKGHERKLDTALKRRKRSDDLR